MINNVLVLNCLDVRAVKTRLPCVRVVWGSN